MNVLSALYPAIPSRMELLRDVLPLHVIRGTQTLTVLVGFFLILLADGLRKRRRRAMQIVVVLLLASSVLNLAKGLDFEEASIAAALALGLVACRSAFNVSSVLPTPRRLLSRIGALAVMLYGYVILGFLVLRHAVRPAPTLSTASLEPLRALWDAPHFHYLTPQSQWFERSFAFLSSVALLFVLVQLLQPLIPHRSATPLDLSRVRGVVHRYGSDTLSYFAFQHGRSYFFDDTGEAFLSYRLWRTVAIVGGHAVGPCDRIPALIAQFIAFTTENGIEPCFLGISGADLGVYGNLGLRTLKVGEEALIDLPSFDTSALKRKVRRAGRHIEDVGIRAITYRRDALPASIVQQMEDISRNWIAARGGSERGFSMTLGRLPGSSDGDCEITLGMKGDRVCGYLCVVPAYSGSAWSLDSMRRHENEPNGLMEYLVMRAAETYRDRGFRTLSLNFATLSNAQNNIDSRILENTRRFLYDHLSSVYQLRSLEQFNGKFQPIWQSRYLAFREVRVFPKLAVAIAQSEDPIRIPALFRGKPADTATIRTSVD